MILDELGWRGLIAQSTDLDDDRAHPAAGDSGTEQPMRGLDRVD